MPGDDMPIIRDAKDTTKSDATEANRKRLIAEFDQSREPGPELTGSDGPTNVE